MDSNVMMIAVAAAAVVLVIVLVWMLQRSRRASLRRRFGPEYERAVEQYHGERAAERELVRRERRVAKLDIRPLSREDAARFSDGWRRTQSRFVDDPGAAILDADRLVAEVMRARGYPMGEFEERVADISVDHSNVVSNYRAARAIAARHERGEASTEDLRQAMVHYRELFTDLLEVQEEKLRRAAGGRR